MGLMTIRQFFGDHAPIAPLSETEARRVSDVERIARTLASQLAAPAEKWPFFVEPAEELIRYNTLLIESC